MHKIKLLGIAVSLALAIVLVFYYYQNNSISIFETCKLPPLFEEGFDIIIVAGQSNAIGYGKGPYEDLQIPNEQSQIFQIGRGGSNDGKIIPAHEQLDHWSKLKDNTGVGFAMTFARQYARKLRAPNRRILLVPAAHNGTDILLWSVPRSLEEPTLYTKLYFDMILRTRSALQASAAVPQRNRVVAVLWHQGEANLSAMIRNQLSESGKTVPNPAAYEPRLVQLIQSLRKEFSERLPFLMGQVMPDSDADHPIRKEFDQRLETLAKRIPCVAFVSSNGLKSNSDFDPALKDGDHFSAKSMVEFGRRYFNAYVAMVEL